MGIFLRAALAALVAVATESVAVPLSYFGEDRGVFNQDGSPTGTGFASSSAARAAFLGSLSGVGTESLESFADGTTAPLLLAFPGAGTASLTGSGQVDDDPGLGENATSGSKFWRTGAGNTFDIEFASPVAAFGFYGVDIGDVGAQLILSLTLAAGGTLDIAIPHTVEAGGPSSGQNGSVIFFGYIDPANTWTKATFQNQGGGQLDGFGFDDMTIGSTSQVVPEPSTWALILFGLLSLSRLIRRVPGREV